MNQKSSQEKKNRPRLYFAGVGLVFGAGIGAILSLLFFSDLPWAIGIGAGMGLVIGAAIDAYKDRESDSADMQQD